MIDFSFSETAHIGKYLPKMKNYHTNLSPFLSFIILQNLRAKLTESTALTTGIVPIRVIAEAVTNSLTENYGKHAKAFEQHAMSDVRFLFFYARIFFMPAYMMILNIDSYQQQHIYFQKCMT